jgi:hypothetical protein
VSLASRLLDRLSVLPPLVVADCLPAEPPPTEAGRISAGAVRIERPVELEHG